MVRRSKLVAVLLVGGVLAVSWFVWSRSAEDAERRARAETAAALWRELPTPTEISFDSVGVTLSGSLFLPDGDTPVPAAILVHGSGEATRRHGFFARVAGPLLDSGIAVFAYDKRGVGRSEGQYHRVDADNSRTVLSDLAADAGAAADLVRQQPRIAQDRVGYLGISQAGWTIPLAMEHDPHGAFAVMVSGPTVSVAEEIAHSMPGFVARFYLERDDHGFDPAPLLRESRVPSLWVFGDRDDSIPVEASIAILEALPGSTASDGRTIIRIADADHNMRDAGSGLPAPFEGTVVSWLCGIVTCATATPGRPSG